MTTTRKLMGRSVVSLVIVTVFLFCATTSRIRISPTEQGTKEEMVSKSDFFNLIGMSGHSSQDPGENLNESQKEDLLALLGINDTEEGERSTVKIKAEELQQVVLQLQHELDKRGKEIANLRLRARSLDEKIAALRKEIAKYKVAAKSRGLRGQVVQHATDTFRQRYNEALSQFYARHYRRAIAHFEALFDSNPQHSLAENCQYWIGESYYALGKFRLALLAFQKVLARGGVNKADDAQLMIGLSLMKLGQKLGAKTELERFVVFFSNSEYLSKAERYLKSLHNA